MLLKYEHHCDRAVKTETSRMKLDNFSTTGNKERLTVISEYISQHQRSRKDKKTNFLAKKGNRTIPRISDPVVGKIATTYMPNGLDEKGRTHVDPEIGK